MVPHVPSNNDIYYLLFGSLVNLVLWDYDVVRRILDETSVFGIDDDSYIEYENIEDFKQWILSLRPKDVRGKGISERGLRNFKQKIKNGKGLKNRSKIARILFEYYKSKLSEQ